MNARPTTPVVSHCDVASFAKVNNVSRTFFTIGMSHDTTSVSAKPWSNKSEILETKKWRNGERQEGERSERGLKRSLAGERSDRMKFNRRTHLKTEQMCSVVVLTSQKQIYWLQKSLTGCCLLSSDFAEQRCDWSARRGRGSAGRPRRRGSPHLPRPHHTTPTTSSPAWRTSSSMSSHTCQVSTCTQMHTC